MKKKPAGTNPTAASLRFSFVRLFLAVFLQADKYLRKVKEDV